MRDSFSDATCVVTGAGSGIGRECVLQLNAAGALVHALDVNAGALEALRDEVVDRSRCTVHTVDVRSSRGMEEVAGRIHRGSGHVDLLINNAGVTLVDELANVSFAQWRRVLDTNYMGLVHGVHFFYSEMVERGAGHIVNIGSIAGSAGYATADAYAVSKGAVLGFTRSLRLEAEVHGVEVTLVCPGYVDSAIFSEQATPNCRTEEIAKTFMTRPVSSREAARSILDGLRKGRKTIVFPFSGRVLYLVSRWFPAFLPPLQRVLLRRYRAIQA